MKSKMGVDKNSFMYYTIGTKKKKGIDSNEILVYLFFYFYFYKCYNITCKLQDLIYQKQQYEKRIKIIEKVIKEIQEDIRRG